MAGPVVKVNVGGTGYTANLSTLRKEPNSILAAMFEAGGDERFDVLTKLEENTFFLDRDAQLFRPVLEYLRTGKVILPEGYKEVALLKEEAKYFDLKGMLKQLNLEVGTNLPGLRDEYIVNGGTNDEKTGGDASYRQKQPEAYVNCGAIDHDDKTLSAGHITIGYRATFAFGRDGQADVKFRKLNRILVGGRATICREVFGESLNESRDPDRVGAERYTSRLYLKHQSVEKAFDALAVKGFSMVGMSSSGANGLSGSSSGLPMIPGGGNSADMNPRSSGDYEEQRWAHYSEYIFYRAG